MYMYIIYLGRSTYPDTLLCIVLRAKAKVFCKAFRVDKKDTSLFTQALPRLITNGALSKDDIKIWCFIYGPIENSLHPSLLAWLPAKK